MSTAELKRALSVERVRTLAFAAFGVGFLLLSLPAFWEPMTFWTGIVLGDYIYPTHELHHLVLGSFFVVLLLGVVVQAYRPAERLGALHTSLVMWATVVLVLASATVVLSGEGDLVAMHLVLLGLLVGMAATHPERGALPSRDDLDVRMAGFAAVTAVVALVFAASELSAHLTAGDAHVEFGHYVFTTALGASVAALGVYASFRGPGWRYPAYAAALLVLVVGLGSVVYPGPEQGSSLGVALGAAAVVWALAWLAVAERDLLVERFDL